MSKPAAIYMRVGDEVPASPETNQILVYFDDLGIMYIEFDGQTAEVYTSVNIPFGTTTQDIAGTGAGGSAESASRSDHVHRGVLTVKKSGDASIYGTITLSEAGGIALTQVGNDISIQSTTTSTFIGLTDTPSSYTLTNVVYTSNGTPDAVIESGARLTVGTNLFHLIRGTTDLYVSTSCNIDQNLSTVSSVTFGAAHIGGVANYTDFDTSGKQIMLGTARVTRSQCLSPTELVVIQGTFNSVVVAANSVQLIYSDQWYFMEFHEGNNSACAGFIRVPFDYENGTNITLEVIWAPKTNVGGNMILHAGFLKAVENSVFPTTDVGVYSSQTVASPATAYQQTRTSFTVTGTSLSAGDLIRCQVFRDASNVADTSGARTEVAMIIFKYTSNKLGA